MTQKSFSIWLAGIPVASATCAARGSRPGVLDQAVRHNRPAIPAQWRRACKLCSSAKEDAMSCRRTWPTSTSLWIRRPTSSREASAKSGSRSTSSTATSVGLSSRSRRIKGRAVKRTPGTGSGTLPGAATSTVAGTCVVSPSWHAAAAAPAAFPQLMTVKQFRLAASCGSAEVVSSYRSRSCL